MSTFIVCPGCTLVTGKKTEREGGVYISEIQSQTENTVISHSWEFDYHPFSLSTCRPWLNKHGYLLRGERGSRSIRSCVIMIENPSHDMISHIKELTSIEDEAWAYIRWCRNNLSYDSATFSPLWWQSQSSSTCRSRFGEQPTSSPAASSSSAISIPLTLLADERTARRWRSPNVSTCYLSGSILSSSPYPSLSEFAFYDNSWIDVSENLMIHENKPRSDAYIPTSKTPALSSSLLISKVFIFRRIPIFKQHYIFRDSARLVRSGPWAGTFLSPVTNFDIYQTELYPTESSWVGKFSAEILKHITNVVETSQGLRCDFVTAIRLFILARVIPYLHALLAFEIWSLSAQLDIFRVSYPASDSLKRTNQSIQRCETKLYCLKACMKSADDQTDNVLSRLNEENAAETLPQRKICGELRELVRRFHSTHAEALDFVKLLKGNSINAMQMELTNLQIQESRQAIAQADTVANLTILAFIFIPISTVAGIFGMNVIEIGDGTRLWMFGVTAGAVVAGTLLLAFSGTVLSWFAFFMVQLKERLGGSDWEMTHKLLILLTKVTVWLWRRIGIWKDSLIAWKRAGEALRKRFRELRSRDLNFELDS